MALHNTGIFLNAVQIDTDWKRRVNITTNNQLYTWPKKWSFLLEEYQKMYDAMDGKRPISPYEWSRWHYLKPEKDQALELPVEKTRVYQRPRVREKGKFVLPRAASGWYGYTHLVKGRNLVADRQRLSQQNVGQRDLIKVLGWPMDNYD